jgi:GntR family transcriptional regulator
MSQTTPPPELGVLDRGPDAPPLYRQLTRELRTLAESVGAGERFPSERELTERYDVSRVTVQQAIADLVRSGHLRRQQGRGTFVSEPKVERPLQATNSFSEDMRQKGLAPSSELVSHERLAANGRLSRELGVEAGAEVVLVERLMLADDEPMAVHQTYLRGDLCGPLIERHIDELRRGGSLYDLLENTGGLQLAEAEETVEATQASAEIADLLGMNDGDPILWIVRRTSLTDGTRLELSEMSYRGDRYRLTLHTSRRVRA